VIPVRWSSPVTVIVISGKISIPALGPLILRGRVPHLRLTDRGTRGCVTMLAFIKRI
jgi:hypothetical protein